MPAAARINDQVQVPDPDQGTLTGQVTKGSATVFIGDDAGGGAGPVVPASPLFSLPDDDVVTISADQQAAYQSNVANVEQYNNPYNQSYGITDHPEMPSDPNNPPTVVAPATINPNCNGSVVDMGVVLATRLQEASTGMWKETGSNPNIQALYAGLGFPNIKGDQTAWCAGFVGNMLKNNCFKYMKTLLAHDYCNYGNPIDISQAQKGDIIILFRKQGSGHVGFYYGPGTAPGTFQMVAGNQSNNVTNNTHAKVSDIQPNGVQRPRPITS